MLEGLAEHGRLRQRTHKYVCPSPRLYADPRSYPATHLERLHTRRLSGLVAYKLSRAAMGSSMMTSLRSIAFFSSSSSATSSSSLTKM